MKIRTYKPEDQESVVALWKACELTRPWNNPNEDISRKLAVQPKLFFVGELEDVLIASAMAGYDGHRGSVFYLAISPQYQGSGYGKQLMQHIETVLESMGCPKANILVRSSNQKVMEFYDSLGYSIDEVVSFGKRLIPDD